MLKIGDRIKDYVIVEIGFDTFTEKRELTLVSVRPAIIDDIRDGIRSRKR